jgi:prepilin-type N-terminal cleavage/methylation domain-containing protein
MNSSSTIDFRKSGFTLAELLIAAGVSSIILAALLSGAIALQRSFQASDYYAAALNDQTRALDYIVRDTRGALAVSVSADGNTLTVTLPDYYSVYDAQGNPSGPPVTPVLASNATVYNNAATPVMIAYYVENRLLIRQVTIGRTGAISKTVIAKEVDNFDFTFGVVDSTVSASLSFSPRFRGILTSTDELTRRTATVYMRNHKST